MKSTEELYTEKRSWIREQIHAYKRELAKLDNDYDFTEEFIDDESNPYTKAFRKQLLNVNRDKLENYECTSVKYDDMTLFIYYEYEPLQKGDNITPDCGDTFNIVAIKTDDDIIDLVRIDTVLELLRDKVL